MSERDWLAFVEACYRVEQPERDWLRGVTEAAVPLMSYGNGIHAYTVDLALPGLASAEPILVAGHPEWEEHWRACWWDRFMTRVGTEDFRILHSLSPVSFTSGLFGAVAARSTTYAEHMAQLESVPYARVPTRYRGGETRAAPPIAAALGFMYPDSFNVMALDASGRGAAFAANMSEPAEGSPHPTEVGLWTRLGAHVAAGYRLQRRLREIDKPLVDQAEAIVTPAGRVEHAAPELRDSVALEALRERVIMVDKARAHLRHDARAATEVWTGLTEGRWSLVDQFERGGRRYYLARPNAPEVGESAALTEREAQVARAAAMGHSNKHIAYELGVAMSTVAANLKSAAAKLGVGSRLELIRVVRRTLDTQTPTSR